MGLFTDFIKYISNCVATSRWNDYVDILVVTFIIYQALKFFRNTRAAQLLKGIIFFVIVMQLADLLNMNATSYLLRGTLQFGVLALLIMFQPELRKVLEQVGKGSLKRLFTADENKLKVESEGKMVDEICNAAFYLSAAHTGALIVFERGLHLNEIINTGVIINSDISSSLIESIFFPRSPLHDGAIIIKNGKVKAASCLLPLSESDEISMELGTRHRAALGLSEASDAVILVVSEQTSTISVASAGVLKRGFTKESLNKELSKYFDSEEKKEKKHRVWRVKKK